MSINIQSWQEKAVLTVRQRSSVVTLDELVDRPRLLSAQHSSRQHSENDLATR